MKINWDKITVWFVFISFIGLMILFIGVMLNAGYMVIEMDMKNDFCIEQGFDYNDYDVKTTEGHISCCSYIYENNIKIDDTCIGVKYE